MYQLAEVIMKKNKPAIRFWDLSSRISRCTAYYGLRSDGFELAYQASAWCEQVADSLYQQANPR
jgi:hypothetical protein